MHVKIRFGKFVRIATLTALAVVAVSASADAQEKSPWQAIGGLYGGYHTVESTNQAGDFTYNVDTRSGDLELIFGLFLDAWANRWGGVIEAGRVSEDYDDLLFSDELLTVNGTLEQQLFSLEGFAYFTLWGAEKDRPLDVLVGARSFFLRSKIAIFSNQTQFGTIDVKETISSNWVDPTIGLRWKTSRVNEFWGAFRADVGGFDIGSKLSWQVRVEGGLRITDTFDLVFAVKHTDIDYDNGEAGADFIAHDASHGNFLIAALFRFQ